MAGSLSDSELYARLRALGVDVGPITSTTRAVYLRKLNSLTSRGSTLFPKPVPAVQTTTPRPATPPSPPAPLAAPPQPHPAIDVVEQLLKSLNIADHPANDTAFLFPDGEVVLASRGILAIQCPTMIPLLYNNQVPYPIKVATLSGQVFQFLVRPGELVRDLKEKLCLVQGVPLPQQRLLFMQQELQDERTFQSYPIQPDATLHLVLVTSGANVPAVSYRSPNITPTLSITHVSLGLKLDELLKSSGNTSPSDVVSLAPHLAHLVHLHDMHYHPGFLLFLEYLYGSRQFLESHHGLDSCVVCCVLAGKFQIPALVTASMSSISCSLTTECAQALLRYAELTRNQALSQVCSHHLTQNPHN